MGFGLPPYNKKNPLRYIADHRSMSNTDLFRSQVNDYDLQDANWINLSVTRNFTQRDIDTNRLRYVHTGNLHDEPRDQVIPQIHKPITI